MNGIGMGTTVGLGTIISLGIISPAAATAEYLATFFVYGFVAGLLFELYRFALRGWKPPFFRS